MATWLTILLTGLGIALAIALSWIIWSFVYRLWRGKYGQETYSKWAVPIILVAGLAIIAITVLKSR